MAPIPTDGAVKALGDDSVGLQVHYAALDPKVPCCVLLPPLPLAAKYAAPACGCGSVGVRSILGGMGDIYAR